MLTASSLLHGHGFDIVWGLITAVVGAVLGVLVQALVSRGNAGYPPLASQNAQMAKKVPIASAATRKRNPGTARKKSVLSDEDALVFALVVAAGAVALFLRWRETITAAITIASVFLYGCQLGMIGYAAWRNSLCRRDLIAVPLGGLVIVAIGLSDARALTEPRFIGGSYANLLAAFDHGGLSRVVDRFGIEGVVFVLYQLIGVLFFGAAVALAVIALAFVIGRMNHALASRGERLWAPITVLASRPGRGPTAVITVGCAFAVFSWVLCSGLSYDVIRGLVEGAVLSR
jgi:hypothetical protein